MTKKPELSEDLITFAQVKSLKVNMNTESNLKPYTIEELRERIAISERQFAAGQWQDFDEAMDEIEAELADVRREPSDLKGQIIRKR